MCTNYPFLADLVVLSACQTNTGKNAPGEGTLGLGQGFAPARTKGDCLWSLECECRKYWKRPAIGQG